MRKLIVVVLLLALLAGGVLYTGVASPLVQGQVESALTRAGIGDRRAACMAERMVERLSLMQLWKLRQGMAARAGEPESGYGLGELVKRLRRVEDGEAVAVLTTSAGLCAIGIG